ncbi:TetR family transcriptional regulator [Dactylosporangium vinaceum]|uniref:TetR/AcrR family transcriptional regulator n=1 Tax=Dactylosporangium vinaceum TaxID=53362 RepID=A0ABV5MPV1_9ACTN|nr:TetR/AcrR family transcriptional regulator [Dactylosporangium vinaceum]UAB96654.1 TetR family transcriptional regulator [Dactylosporangium vinaceum]
MATDTLRERKKAQTRSALWNAAIELFVEYGFDNVSVAQIAAAAEVSKMTFFNYYPSKEDLVVGPLSEHIGDPAEIVRARAQDESPVDALHRHFLAGLAARDPSTGLCDKPNILAVVGLVFATPSLTQRALTSFNAQAELLAAELGQDFRHRAAAAMIVGARNALITENINRLLAGATADEQYPTAVANANQAFDLLRAGL